MAVATRERANNRTEIRIRIAAARAPTVRKPNVWASPLRVGSREAAAQATGACQDKKVGFFSSVARGFGELFTGLGFFGPAKWWLQGSRLISPREKTLLEADSTGSKQILPFTIPGASALRRDSPNFKDG